MIGRNRLRRELAEDIAARSRVGAWAEREFNIVEAWSTGCVSSVFAGIQPMLIYAWLYSTDEAGRRFGPGGESCMKVHPTRGGRGESERSDEEIDRQARYERAVETLAPIDRAILALRSVAAGRPGSTGPRNDWADWVAARLADAPIAEWRSNARGGEWTAATVRDRQSAALTAVLQRIQEMLP